MLCTQRRCHASNPTSTPHRVLLQITAMRYACLAHGAEAECSADVHGWCMWGAQGCSLYYDDADFVGLLLWSNVSVACNGSLLADVVRCSFELYRSDCNNAPGCMWLQEVSATAHVLGTALCAGTAHRSSRCVGDLTSDQLCCFHTKCCSIVRALCTQQPCVNISECVLRLERCFPSGRPPPRTLSTTNPAVPQACYATGLAGAVSEPPKLTTFKQQASALQLQ